jgi:hypothetical protein
MAMVTKSRPKPPIQGNFPSLSLLGLWNETFSAMQRLFTATLMATVLLFGFGAQACEKHLHGHQNSSNTGAEATNN